MDSDFRFFGLRNVRRVVIASAAVVALAGTCPSRAESPASLGQNHCAGLGGDFVAVTGQRGCVRIGGHVRAETTHARAVQAIYPPALEPLGDGVRPASESFHVRAGSPGGDIVPR